MRKLSVFNFVTLNGYFQGKNGDISWGHSHPQNDYAAESAGGGDILLFGRKTYELMVQFWPTPEAMKSAPEVAEGMNKAEKIVFSRTLDKVEWNNTRVMKDNVLEEIKKMKQTPGSNMTVLGSGSIVNQFADAGLIDEIQLLVQPVALSEGTPILKDIKGKVEFNLTNSRVFETGNVLLVYQPVM
ncbi:MAG TPA: dihydrofolate reductase family protein [Blastocatellia bacterium]|nr:dihydrofolate reductase family protein [Blastocatellia bacterium]